MKSLINFCSSTTVANGPDCVPLMVDEHCNHLLLQLEEGLLKQQQHRKLAQNNSLQIVAINKQQQPHHQHHNNRLYSSLNLMDSSCAGENIKTLSNISEMESNNNSKNNGEKTHKNGSSTNGSSSESSSYERRKRSCSLPSSELFAIVKGVHNLESTRKTLLNFHHHNTEQLERASRLMIEEEEESSAASSSASSSSTLETRSVSILYEILHFEKILTNLPYM